MKINKLIIIIFSFLTTYAVYLYISTLQLQPTLGKINSYNQSSLQTSDQNFTYNIKVKTLYGSFSQQISFQCNIQQGFVTTYVVKLITKIQNNSNMLTVATPIVTNKISSTTDGYYVILDLEQGFVRPNMHLMVPIMFMVYIISFYVNKYIYLNYWGYLSKYDPRCRVYYDI